MWQTLIKIVDDSIHAEGVPYTELTPREQHTREAMFAVTVVAPLTGALLALFFAPASHRPKYSLYFCPDTESEMRHLHINRADAEREKLRNLVRYYKLVACWFTSIAVFGTVIYLQAGRTTRFTFVLAVFHNQIEVLIAGLLMGFARETCVAASLVYGLIMIPLVLVSTTMSVVFIGAAIVGGGIDMLIVLLLLYGKQYILAAGAIGHVSSAVAVFTNVLDNIGVLPYNLCIFLGLWTHIGFTLIGILYAGSLHKVQHQLGNVDLHIEPASPTFPEDEHAPMPAIITARRSPSPGRRKFVAHTTGNGHAPDPANATNGFLRHSSRNGRVSPSLSIDSRVSNSHEGSGSDKEDSPTSPQSDSEFKHFCKRVRHEQYRAQCFAANPLRHVRVSLGPFIGMLVLSLVGSTFITLVLAFHAPSWGGSEWGRSQEHSWIWNLFDNDAKRGRGLAANPQVSLH